MLVSLFHGSIWSNPHVKETVFISQNFLQLSIIINGLQLIQEKAEEYVYLRKTIERTKSISEAKKSGVE